MLIDHKRGIRDDMMTSRIAPRTELLNKFRISFSAPQPQLQLEGAHPQAQAPSGLALPTVACAEY
jgi:hypothetical protein